MSEKQEQQSSYHWIAENYARRAEDSPADRWSTAYIEQCRKGERQPMFTPPDCGVKTPAPLIPTINEFH